MLCSLGYASMPDGSSKPPSPASLEPHNIGLTFREGALKYRWIASPYRRMLLFGTLFVVWAVVSATIRGDLGDVAGAPSAVTALWRSRQAGATTATLALFEDPVSLAVFVAAMVTPIYLCGQLGLAARYVESIRAN